MKRALDTVRWLLEKNDWPRAPANRFFSNFWYYFKRSSSDGWESFKYLLRFICIPFWPVLIGLCLLHPRLRREVIESKAKNKPLDS